MTRSFLNKIFSKNKNTFVRLTFISLAAFKTFRWVVFERLAWEPLRENSEFLCGVFLKQNTTDTIRLPQNTDQKNSKYGHLFTLWDNTQFHIKTDIFPDFLLLKIHIFPVSIRNSHRGMNSCNKLFLGIKYYSFVY